MIPVSVLTGFLGSGKTTLLARMVRQPAFARTAVIINELGEIGIDHDLVRTSEESLVELSTGCLCCAVRGDLAATLMDLVARRAAGGIAPFERIVIETSGLADPAPILQLLMTDAALAERLVLAGVVATIDAMNGLGTLERHAEALKQAAVADRLIVTKTDLTGGVPAALGARLTELNPAALQIAASFGAVEPQSLLGAGAYGPAGKIADVARWLGMASSEATAGDVGRQPRHAGDITSMAVVREVPIPAVALALFLEAIAEHCGADLLRLKGIVDVAESPERPAVVHGVQHVFHPLDWLDVWPSADRRSRLVLIGRGLRREWVEALLDAITLEVASLRVDNGARGSAAVD